MFNSTMFVEKLLKESSMISNLIQVALPQAQGISLCGFILVPYIVFLLNDQELVSVKHVSI